jgi:hypothetical protein
MVKIPPDFIVQDTCSSVELRSLLRLPRPDDSDDDFLYNSIDTDVVNLNHVEKVLIEQGVVLSGSDEEGNDGASSKNYQSDCSSTSSDEISDYWQEPVQRKKSQRRK